LRVGRFPFLLAAAALVAGALWLVLARSEDGDPGIPRFEDVARETGIDFTHANFATPERYLVETMGGGVALFDADGDGDLDVFLVQGAPAPGDARDRPPHRLFRNEGRMRFVDATAEAGVAGTGYGQGCAVGDFEGDGDADLFVACFGPDLFFVNRGGARFEERAREARLADPGWGTSAAFLDADLDGDLDLYVARYVKASYVGHPRCVRRGHPVYCHPDAFEGLEDRFYRNEGDGTFSEIGARAGVARAGPLEGKGLGVVAGDFDEDGLPDLFVANDSTANFLYLGRGDCTFEETGILAGVAFSPGGRAEAGMGVDAGDVDGDGRLDLVVTNLNGEPTRLHRNVGGGFIDDATETAGLASPSLPLVGFGVGFFDADGDGALDLLFVNGHVLDNIEAIDSGQTYRQRRVLMRNRGDGTFEEISASAGEVFALPRAGRAAAFGDLDGDGDVDVVVTNCGEPAEVLRNGGVRGRRWIRLRLVGVRSVRDGIGAEVRIAVGGRLLRRDARSGHSYLAASDARVTAGLGENDQVDRVEIRWPSGQVDLLEGLAADREYHVREGAGAHPP
jgi:hypothetical protein